MDIYISRPVVCFQGNKDGLALIGCRLVARCRVDQISYSYVWTIDGRNVGIISCLVNIFNISHSRCSLGVCEGVCVCP